MENSKVIYAKLELFIKKFYFNELLRGGIFFIGLGLLYLFFISSIEYFLWLRPLARTFLFFIFIAVEFFLLARYILLPSFKLFKLQKGIDYNYASLIIGKHFRCIDDKLTNFLQLANNDTKSDLLVASIDQKVNLLQAFPFSNAINFRENRKFLPLVVLPLLILAVLAFSGQYSVLSQSISRVVNFKKQYLPPAPFQFMLINKKLETEQNKDFVLDVKTVGSVVPDNAKIYIGSESYFMQSAASGVFRFVIPKPASPLTFRLEANGVSSVNYLLDVISVPTIANFEMILSFPTYLKKKPEVVKGSGNAIVPEGTKIAWRVTTKATQSVNFIQGALRSSFVESNAVFNYAKIINQNTDYQIITSNNKVQNFEKLNYQIVVTKDQYPVILVNNAPDSLKVDKNFVLGSVSDDFGITKLNVVYFPASNSSEVKRGAIKVNAATSDRFIFQFPSNLNLEEGVAYEYYFEVFDNDAPHGYKSSRSSSFTYRESTKIEKEDLNMKQQSDNINSLSKSLQTQAKQLNELDKLKKMGQEKESLDFKDQRKVDDFIERQKKQDEMMKEFTDKLKDNVDKTKTDKKDQSKELLKSRLEKTKDDIEKNKKLLDELSKLNEKLSKEELFDKIEKFKQTAKNQSKSLQQLVELTKRFYVEKKAEQLAKKLDELAVKQDKLAGAEKENSVEKQNEINKEFNQIQDELKNLQKENQELKKPLDIPNTDSKEKSINDDLNKAAQELKKNAKANASSKQKSAAKKMKQMGAEMQSEMEGGDKEQMEEDVVMLRQILDNLVAYSFSQEEVMKQFKSLKRGSPVYNKNLKIQQDLKQQFKHVDDSLFAMSLRNPKLEEGITKEIGSVQYNIDKAIDNLADANVPKGVSYQQFAVAGANRLADVLADILTGMQMSLSMKGSGKGQGMPSPGKGSGSGSQLPDIIQKQGKLAEKAKSEKEKGDKPGDGKDGQGDKEGKDGQSGRDGKGGKGGKGKSGSGKDGNGQGGNGNQNGEDSENNAQQIMQIYKEQQQLREALQNELNKQGVGNQGQSAIEQMKQLEKQLLNKGFDNDVLQRMLNLKYELIKLDKAIQLQGEEKKRQAETNIKVFNNTSNALPTKLQNYINSAEILNRQSVPLQPSFNQKVQIYFKPNDKF